MTVTAPEKAPAADVPKAGATRLVDRIFKMRELAILLVFLVMIGITQAGNSEFLSEQGIKDLLLNATILVLVATGQSLVVITRNVDLSVGSTSASAPSPPAPTSRAAATPSWPCCSPC